MASLCFRKFDDLVGRSDLLVQRKNEKTKSRSVDLSAIIYREEGPSDIPGGKAIRNETNQIHKINTVLDKALIEKC